MAALFYLISDQHDLIGLGVAFTFKPSLINVLDLTLLPSGAVLPKQQPKEAVEDGCFTCCVLTADVGHIGELHLKVFDALKVADTDFLDLYFHSDSILVIMYNIVIL